MGAKIAILRCIFTTLMIHFHCIGMASSSDLITFYNILCNDKAIIEHMHFGFSPLFLP